MQFLREGNISRKLPYEHEVQVQWLTVGLPSPCRQCLQVTTEFDANVRLQALKPPRLQQHKAQYKLQISQRIWINDHFFCHAESTLLQLHGNSNTAAGREAAPLCVQRSAHTAASKFSHTKYHRSMVSSSPIFFKRKTKQNYKYS